MEFVHDFDCVPGVVVVTISGSASAAEYLASLDALRRHSRFEPGMPIISDVSRVDATPLSTSEARRLGEVVQATDLEWGTRRRAVVAPANLSYGLARAAQSAADPEGERMTVVRSFDEAVAWVQARQSA